MHSTYIAGLILLSAVTTFALRSLPFAVFHGERTMPQWLERLGERLPAAIMAVLVIYCVRDAGSDWIGIGIPKGVAVLLVGLTYKWKHNTLFSILAGTVCYMLLLRLM